VSYFSTESGFGGLWPKSTPNPKNAFIMNLSRAQILAGLGQVKTDSTPQVVRTDISKRGGAVARPGDKMVDLSLTSNVPSDLLIEMDNLLGDAPKIFMFGGALPGHLRAFQNPNNYEVTGDWVNPDNFIANNDELIRYYLLNMGLAVRAVDRQTNLDVNQFNNPVTAIRGTYNNQVNKNITTQLNHFSSMDYDRKINNVILQNSELDLTFFNTYFIQVGIGEKLIYTFRINEGINWPIEVKG